ncbi:MAG: hypothetical protein CBB87_10470 [Micavibrio sp. TMED27]|nr:hypothetical protein [Micavibrio sp.]OUT90177.1 MAG: hypothetical protein CBB87_10470 [Micavibrio sp. TMED27]|tara:strand:+ start:1481 stop:2368 length:888 start_codon:yes stop_codon:yes gene_type:complete
MKYNEENIAILLRRIKRLKSEHGVSRGKVLLYLQREIEAHNKENPKDQIKLVKHASFNGRINKPVKLMNIFDEGAFRILLKYFDQKLGINFRSESVEKISEAHSALTHFASVSGHDDDYLRKMLPGRYRTYRPAIGKPGYAVVGILEVIEDSKNNSIQTYEVMAYQERKAGQALPRHTFNGMAWYSKGHYLIMSIDSNTKFFQNIFLRSMQADRAEEQLEGTYLTVTNKGGKNIVSSKIILDRIHCSPGDGAAWFRELRYMRGYKHLDAKREEQRIEQSIWDRIDPENPNNFVRM